MGLNNVVWNTSHTHVQNKPKPADSRGCRRISRRNDASIACRSFQPVTVPRASWSYPASAADPNFEPFSLRMTKTPLPEHPPSMRLILSQRAKMRRSRSYPFRG